ncbi:MAG: DUF1501 domain-containing protein [Pseudomonadota bacterium]
MLNRRRFLTHSCSLGVAGATLSSSLLQLGLARSVSAQTEDYRALVCILLAGGNDSYNMLVPRDNDQYEAYRDYRSDLALPKNQLLPLDGSADGGRRYGLHPGMAGLQSLFNGGDAAMLCNVGTLLEPWTGEPDRVPLGLYSHADQIQQWQTSVADQRMAQGWGGRIADILQGPNPANGISMNISLSGSNVFQSGNDTAEYSISAQGNGAPGLNNYDNGTPEGDFRKAMVDGLLAVNQPHILRKEYRQRLQTAVDAQQLFSAALGATPELSTPFSPSYFSQSLRQIARVMSAREALGVSRQTFFVLVGGWDHHDEVLVNQANMLPQISDGLVEFRNAMLELGLHDQVTTFTTSDFGRTLTSNGRGSDHGWGGHHIVMGGAVRGGFYGQYPELDPASPLDTGRGRYAPTTSVDEYFAELALWLGVSPSDLDSVLPNIANFYSPGAASAPMGFLL